MRQPLAPRGVLFADGGIQQHHLAFCVVDQRCHDLAHERIIIQRYFARLIPVDNEVVNSV